MEAAEKMLSALIAVKKMEYEEFVFAV